MPKKGRFDKDDYEQARRELYPKKKTLDQAQHHRVFKRAIKIGKKSSKTSSKPSNPPKAKGGRKTAKKKKNKKKRGLTIPIATVSGIGGALYEPVLIGRDYGIENGFARLCRNVTGWDPNPQGGPGQGYFDWTSLPKFWGPVLLGVGGSILASKAGINKKIAASGLPILRI